MAFFALLIFMYAIVAYYVCWERAYKAMLAGGPVLPAAGYALGCPVLWFGGAYLISVLV